MSAHGDSHDDGHAHDDFDPEPATALAADEPRTPSWLPALGGVAFLVCGAYFLAKFSDSADAATAASASASAAAASANAQAPGSARPRPPQDASGRAAMNAQIRDRILNRSAAPRPLPSALPRPSAGTP
ncbi:MAG: hypothetical protein IPM79_10620 [Polyangiaceae bacterium]|nr:hypothetical protein [Polyangiaceae bacterium]MBK8938073.1 hypothetical protein [Polyangiaceae bacterium]